MKFVSTVRNTNGLDQAYFFLLDSEEHILYSFPVFNGNSRGTLEAIKGVSFKDVNLDGYTDIAIIGKGHNRTLYDVIQYVSKAVSTS